MSLSPAAILEALPNPILAIDKAGAIRFVNGAAENFFHTSRAALGRCTLADLMPFASPVLSAVAQARATGAAVSDYAVSAGTPRTGGERAVDVQAAPAEEGGGIVVMLLERSMAHKIDRQLSHHGAARSVAGMAAILAHEIKNPLAGIRGAAQLLEPALGRRDRSLARLICEETDRIRNLVDQMEVFSDERPLERRPVNIHAVLERVRAATLAGRARRVVIREDYDPSLPPVLGNRDQLIQVFMNLVNNAVEAIEASGREGDILLTTAFRPGVRLSIAGGRERLTLALEICVRDTGPGVPEDVRAHIFDPFVTTKPGGKGLGLALVAKIVRDHGGVVECEARDKGAVFRILLPMPKRGGEAAPSLPRPLPA